MLRAPGAGDDKGTNHFAALLGAALVLGPRGAVVAQPPPPDGDRDGVPDDDDKCPQQAGHPPSGCPAGDTDGDGLNDDIDKCPKEPETVNGVADDDGCPDAMADRDGDGVSDATDACPDEAEDRDGFDDGDGCPDPDNDGDGILDSADHCPTEKGPVENHGCADTDKDGDGVIDRMDNCPDEAGTAANQGCKEKQLVVITQTQLKILDKVYFDTGKATIQKRSDRLLDNVANVLVQHPEIRVRVEGHTDDVGDADKNKYLSQKRADAVVDYLTGKGVAGERLEAVGYGEDKPIADNKSAAGKAQNRRVEFNIVEQAPTSTAAPAVPEKAKKGDVTIPPP
jgi:OmpA-OmpF porin, OOP family